MPTDPGSAIPGVLVDRPQAHGDPRGRFVEILRASRMPAVFAQANHSRSAAGALRGLHYHRHQADLWYLVTGRCQVALADLRGGCGVPAVETFVLDADSPATVYIPAGVAHGYLALTDIDIIYWVTSEYDPSDENGVAWNDPTLAIDWQLDGEPVVSARDAANPELSWDLIPAFA
ncbi:MAG: dTDP-4-dehydrorhamnose 3,5-epimerase [Gaiellales bacterium]|jgi:dTDP-4-dehydrorhamnose 3,5-epimerase|nr:dTDP-4-dehydrorhamnose 3,5-epimerase [Gaiellales bacterium]MDX6549982.1 dTDP-4-dehydrorhamnose 3,5-epimerase [Gaiellales bacterium]